MSRDADELLEAARTNWDLATRKELYRRFQAVFTEQLPALPLYYPVHLRGGQGSAWWSWAPWWSRDRFRSINDWYLNYRKVRVVAAASRQSRAARSKTGTEPAFTSVGLGKQPPASGPGPVSA